jgi:hypothetical protein
MQRLRDNVECADAEYENILDNHDPGLHYKLTFDPKDTILPFLSSITSSFAKAPRVAILREQGVNGHAEMAFAFKAAGFEAVDIHMTDIIGGRTFLYSPRHLRSWCMQRLSNAHPYRGTHPWHPALASLPREQKRTIRS